MSAAQTLTVDPPIPGQNFVALSFVSPERTLVSKEAFVYRRFFDEYCATFDELLTGLEMKFPEEKDSLAMMRKSHPLIFGDALAVHEDFLAWRNTREQELDESYRKEHGEKLTVRGVKVRGVFDTAEKAREYIVNNLRPMDPAFDIYLAQVGAWVPWDPTEKDTQEVDYHEQALTEIVKGYKERMAKVEKQEEEHRERMRQIQEDLFKLRMDRAKAQAEEQEQGSEPEQEAEAAVSEEAEAA